MTEKTYTVSVSGRTYWNVVLPAMQREKGKLDLPTPLVLRAGRGAKARFEGLTEAQALALGRFCQAAGEIWLAENTSAASSILARVFARDGERVLAEVERQKSGAML